MAVAEENDTIATRMVKEDTIVTTMEDDIDEEDGDDQLWEDWNGLDGQDNDDYDEQFMNSDMLCLFCDSLFNSSNLLFQHCADVHHFDFDAIKENFNLDFYGCFKLLNYVRFQVAENNCWSCGIACMSKQDLLNHLHEADMAKNKIHPWDDDKYLRPHMQEDPLLYSFGDDEIGEDELSVNDKLAIAECTSDLRVQCDINVAVSSTPESDFDHEIPSEEYKVNGLVHAEEGMSSNFSSAKFAADKIQNINKNYFGSYSSFGIHREMICDKVRTDAYKEAIMNNPSLIQGATVMDVGCGTGILSLFAAQAGASRVISVEASEKMASVTTQIAKDNGFLRRVSSNEGGSLHLGVIEVVQGMVEELNIDQQVQPHSVDVIVSEWMGYCLLYESMLTSVLFARDKWLKPEGALLPDTATLFVAGFGKGGTSLPFWENVYGLNMSCVGKEINKDASRFPIVDTINSCDIVTSTAVLQAFDLMTMKPDDMDFTAKVELEPKISSAVTKPCSESDSMTQCYGLVLWFETGFTSRFCKEMPIILSTSPDTPKTHWSQTILTFQEPITIASGYHAANRQGAVGTETCPAVRINSRISIVRASVHRSIDISMEISTTSGDGRKCSWPVQMFTLS